MKLLRCSTGWIVISLTLSGYVYNQLLLSGQLSKSMEEHVSVLSDSMSKEAENKPPPIFLQRSSTNDNLRDHDRIATLERTNLAFNYDNNTLSLLTDFTNTISSSISSPYHIIQLGGRIIVPPEQS